MAKVPSSMTLHLQDGSRFEGVSFGAEKSISGECVFQTGMTSYVESLTDPSYKGQILVLSYPLIGNYGVPPDELDDFGLPKFFESSAAVQIAGLVVANYSQDYSHWNACQSLGQWLKKYNVPAVSGVDTRSLIKLIRKSGVMLGKLVHGKDKPEDIPLVDPNKENLVALVSTKEAKTYGKGDLNILLVDCGMKTNQIRCFLSRGVSVRVVPWDFDFVSDRNYDGLFISNGPGDPTMCKQTISHLKTLLEQESAKEYPVPVFGICLGNQLLGLSVGAKTYKMKFGNRGQNQPCVDVKSGRCHLTMQNHGYAIDTNTLPNDWELYFYNCNDDSCEGIRHKTKPFFSVQFHPEANGGPNETEYLFDFFLHLVKDRKQKSITPFIHPLHIAFPKRSVPKVHKVLLLGSGGLSIGQAGEFDYSGSQAIKALKEEGIKTILINPNIATVQTTKGMADQVYFLPVTPEFVKKVIEVEKPDGLLLQFGGQTALNCGIALYREGYFAKQGIHVLGTPVESIIATEDREEFAAKLKEINEHIAPSLSARTVKEAVDAANSIGYPVIVRAGYALGGLGSGFAYNEKELSELVTVALSSSEMVLVERSLKGWKEIEYEVVRDEFDNCITVCNMENFDPLGIHTGESIVVAPSQTLSDKNYHMLRRVAINVVRHLKIVGECNIQYCLDPHSDQYYIIEVNARLSRSSALASKATGYPLAFVAAKLTLGHSLPSLKNAVTKKTTACFEPSLDYIVVKMPRWDLRKFTHVSTLIGTSMKSVGEVMSIGRTFEESISKAMREVGMSPSSSSVAGFESGHLEFTDNDLQNPSHLRIFVIAEALAKGYSVEQIVKLTNIDSWFLHKLKNISDMERTLKQLKGSSNLTPDLIKSAKQLGFSDLQIGRCVNTTEFVIRSMRKDNNITPFVKQIDTVSAEFPAANNYLYITYNASESDLEDAKQSSAANTSRNETSRGSIIVLGSGAYCIGSSVEFDWCAVSCTRALEKLGYKTIMVNYNPETVSTDYDECHKLYFEEISYERVADICEKEPTLIGVVVSMGGQIPNNIAMSLHRHNIPILGTSPEMINTAENRYKFSRLLDSLSVDQPQWRECKTLVDTKAFCEKVGYPCLVRPSFVLSGAGMNVVNTEHELENYLNLSTEVPSGTSTDYSVVISKFIVNAKEIDVDAVAQNGEVVVLAISEHVENAGVHSGDATLILPSQDLDTITTSKIKEATRLIAKSLDVSGPFNIQFIAKDDQIKVIECNVRASRSFPFVSKVLDINFAEIATNVLTGIPVEPIDMDSVLKNVAHIGVKVPMFSFTRLKGADPVLGVEMASTGEVACFGASKYEAYSKALLSTGFQIPKENVLISIGSFKEKQEFLPSAIKLVEMGFKLFGTPGTADYLQENGVPVKPLEWPSGSETDEFSITKHVSSNMIDMCIVLPSKNRYRRVATFMSKGYLTRRLAVDFSIPLITNIKNAKLFVEALRVVPRNIPVTSVDSYSSQKKMQINSLVSPIFSELDGNQLLSEGYTIASFVLPFTGKDQFSALKAQVSRKSRLDYLVFMNQSDPKAKEALSDISILQDIAGIVVSGKQNQTNDMTELSLWAEALSTHFPFKPICVSASDPILPLVLLVAGLYCDHPVHVFDVKSNAHLQLIKKAKAKGLKITCQVDAKDLFQHNNEKPLISNISDIDVVSGIGSLSLLTQAIQRQEISVQQYTELVYLNPKKIFSLSEQVDTFINLELDSNPNSSNKSISQGALQRVVIRGEIALLEGKIFDLQGKLTISNAHITQYGKQIASSADTAIMQPKTPLARSLSTSSLPPHSPTTGPLKQVRGQKPTKIYAPVPPPVTSPTTQPKQRPARSLRGTDIISVTEFDRDTLHTIFSVAQDMMMMVKRVGRLDMLKDCVMANVFYEPSTRTSSSFAAAMERLGGAVVSSYSDSSSVKKGESLADTIRTLDQYVDIIVLRHPESGSAAIAAKYARKPVINAGDGTGEHPTQALLDVFTIRNELGTVNKLQVTLVGDLKNGRTVHSLVKLLALYEGITLTYVSPAELKLPTDLFNHLHSLGVEQRQYTTDEEFHQCIPNTDVLYCTRIQKERFADEAQYNKVKGKFIVTPALLSKAKESMIVMHPLPRVDEISPEVDDDPRAAYFRQMENGMYVRMAILALILGKI